VGAINPQGAAVAQKLPPSFLAALSTTAPTANERCLLSLLKPPEQLLDWFSLIYFCPNSPESVSVAQSMAPDQCQERIS
jgi:hypothetical protein